MEAVLYVCHGSRVKEGNEAARQFITKCKPSIDHAIQEICYLELAQPTIAEGIATCVEKGATKIIVVPILLLSAGHRKYDIPLALQGEREKYPHLHIVLANAFGVSQKIIPILLERLHGKLGKQGKVLLVGRGSSDKEAQQDLQTIASMLQKEIPYEVEACYLTAAMPSFADSLEQSAAEYEHVVVLPYLLFTGLLLKGMMKEIAMFPHVMMANPLGYHPNLKEILKERVDEVKIMTRN